ncbi:MAG: hypothetical protein P8R34_00745 [archaeon]|nr:hypothetical protein [archaeon]
MAIKAFQKHLLYSVFSLALLLRFIHKYDWPIWGSDSGEYLYLSRYLVENGMMLNENYIGWGRAYPDFQGMQILTGTIALVSDVDYYTSLTWFIPLVSGLAIPMLFIIGKELVGFTPALFGSAFYGVTFGVVYANSHPMPGGLAETLGFVLILNWIKILKDGKIWVINPLKRSGWSNMMKFSFIALLITHHFTLLLLMAAMLGILIIEIAAGNKKIATEGLMAVGLMSLPISVYWLIYAKSFRKMLDDSAFDFLPETIPTTIVLTLIPIVSVLILWFIKDKLDLPIWTENITHDSYLKRTIAAFVGVLVVILLVLWQGVPGTDIPVDLEATPYLSVNLAIMSLACVPSFVISKKNGWLLWGWLLPILGLATIGAITGSHLLIAYRHAPYLLAPVALMIGISFQYFVIGFETQKRKYITALFTILLLGCAWGAYPPPSVMGGFQEGTGQEEIDAVLWFNFAEEDSLVASDHRLSSLTFGLTGTNATWENGATVINGNTEEAIQAGKDLPTPQAGRKDVTYVLLSEEMQKGVALLQWDPAEELTGEAKTKFTDNNQFPIWFDNGDTIIMKMPDKSY